MKPYSAYIVLALAIALFSCKGKKERKKQELRISEISDTLNAGIAENSFGQISSAPSNIILTGMDSIRLFAVYKSNPDQERTVHNIGRTTYYFDEEDSTTEGSYRYFMPGIDVVRGFYLINIGHYNLQTNSLTYFFDKPVLVRNLYFPGIKRDFLAGKAIHRNYFLVSVYDEDTNQDSIINVKDMRRFYYFDKQNTQKISLLPKAFSAISSSYDYKNDIMYINAKLDSNGNGIPEANEPISIFWIALESPTTSKKIN